MLQLACSQRWTVHARRHRCTDGLLMLKVKTILLNNASGVILSFYVLFNTVSGKIGWNVI
jgi:hypothetical protein